MQLLQKIFFRLRTRLVLRPYLRRFWWQMQGARFGAGTAVPALSVNWPHQLAVGADCQLGAQIVVGFDGIWQPGPSIVIGDRVFIGHGCEFNIRARISIANDCLIAAGCKFIDHDHGLALGQPMNLQPGPEAAIIIEEDVWLGVNVVVLKGVTIARGAVVAAGAVVTKSVGENEIWGGVPARKIGQRPPANSASANSASANSASAPTARAPA